MASETRANSGWRANFTNRRGRVLTVGSQPQRSWALACNSIVEIYGLMEPRRSQAHPAGPDQLILVGLMLESFQMTLYRPERPIPDAVP
jgi:hypothetical protein